MHNDFLLGIGQLKDSLDTSRRRQLELEKEKKKLLLSLSHDIKTPLNTIQLYARALEEHLYTDEAQNVTRSSSDTGKGEGNWNIMSKNHEAVPSRHTGYTGPKQ